MQNRIKEQQRDLFAERTSAEARRANQARLHFASIAYTLMEALRRTGLAHTELERAQGGTIRNRLLRIGAQVRVGVRRVVVVLSEAVPLHAFFERALADMCGHRPATAWSSACATPPWCDPPRAKPRPLAKETGLVGAQYSRTPLPKARTDALMALRLHHGPDRRPIVPPSWRW